MRESSLDSRHRKSDPHNHYRVYHNSYYRRTAQNVQAPHEQNDFDEGPGQRLKTIQCHSVYGRSAFQLTASEITFPGYRSSGSENERRKAAAVSAPDGKMIASICGGGRRGWCGHSRKSSVSAGARGSLSSLFGNLSGRRLSRDGGRDERCQLCKCQFKGRIGLYCSPISIQKPRMT
jgi:hypothetical protein